jgi:hypothetical protein
MMLVLIMGVPSGWARGAVAHPEILTIYFTYSIYYSESTGLEQFSCMQQAISGGSSKKSVSGGKHCPEATRELLLLKMFKSLKISDY